MDTNAQDVVPFKVFGLQRTGTNLAVALMTRNFHVHSLEVGTEWKHGAVEAADRRWNGLDARYVLCVKNPYAWLLSCYRYFRRTAGSDRTVPPEFRDDPPPTFEQFVTRPSFGFPSPIDRWSGMNRRWLADLPPERTAVVRHEDQLAGQRQTLERLERELGLARRLPALRPVDRRVDVGATLGGPMDQDYYLSRRYLASYTQYLLDRVNRTIDASLMHSLRYELEGRPLGRWEDVGASVPPGPTPRRRAGPSQLRLTRTLVIAGQQDRAAGGR